MLSRDYISRIIRTFFEALEKLFDGPVERDEEVYKKLNDLYKTYLGKSRESFVTDVPEDMVGYLETDPDYIDKCGMLAEVMYREAKWTTDSGLKANLARKVVYLYNLINNHSTDYSLIYVNRIIEMENYLNRPL